MRVTVEEWRKIQKAIADDNLAELIGDMLDKTYEEAYEDGKRDGYEIGKGERES